MIIIKFTQNYVALDIMDTKSAFSSHYLEILRISFTYNLYNLLVMFNSSLILSNICKIWQQLTIMFLIGLIFIWPLRNYKGWFWINSCIIHSEVGSSKLEVENKEVGSGSRSWKLFFFGSGSWKFFFWFFQLWS